MAKRDLFEKLIDTYEILDGKIKNRARLKRALQEILDPIDLQLYFFLPFSGQTTNPKFEGKAKRARISPNQVHVSIVLLHNEGFIYSYTNPGGERVYERTNSVYLAQHQIRKRKGSQLAKVFAEYLRDQSEHAARILTTKTPYFRVLPFEAAITTSTSLVRLPVHVSTPDPTVVLPTDIISEMVKNEPLIAVAECYCRLAARERGKSCDHTTECCFFFSDAAQSLIECGMARQVDHEETRRILYQCEEEGLVHNVDNCEGKIKSLCNCCSCCCTVLDAMQYNKKNFGAPSRFMVAYDEERCAHDFACVRVCPAFAIKVAGSARKVDQNACIGCGLCVAACPEGAIQMVPRPNPPKMVPTQRDLQIILRNEAILGSIKRKLFGKEN